MLVNTNAMAEASAIAIEEVEMDVLGQQGDDHTSINIEKEENLGGTQEKSDGINVKETGSGSGSEDDRETGSESEEGEENGHEEQEDAISVAVWEALKHGKQDVVKNWINSLLPEEQRKELINKHTCNGKMKALHIACFNNQPEVVSLLLEAGADPMVRTGGGGWGRTALHYACLSQVKGGIDKLVRQLLQEMQCEIDVKDEVGRTALHFAAENGHTLVVSLLLVKGAKVEAKDESGDTPVHKAARKGYVEVLWEMISHNPQCVHYESEDNETPLHRAAACGHTPAVSLLLDKGAKMDAKDESGDTPVHKAAEAGRVEVLEVMISHDRECVHYEGDDNETPLHRAATCGHKRAVKQLIHNGASAKVGAIGDVVWRALRRGYLDVVKNWIKSLPEEQRKELINKHTYNGKMKALHIACLNNQPEVASLLLEAGADPMVRTKCSFRQGGRTALHCACLSHDDGDIDNLVRQLLEKKCKIDEKDKRGCTALHYAAKNEHTQTVALLLDNGADIDVKDDDGCTALHRAAENGHTPAVSLLLEEGAKMDAKDESGRDIPVDKAAEAGRVEKCRIDAKDFNKWTALHYAADNGHTPAVSLLLDKGAKVDAKDLFGDTPVHNAARRGHVEVLEVMISHDQECVHYEGDDNETPLHRAAAYGHTRAAEKLIENGASATVKNTNDETPLHQCAATSGRQLAKLLLDAGADAICNAHDCGDCGPLYTACLWGNTDVVTLLMEYGAVVDANCLERAVTRGYERTVMELLKCPQWPELLRHTIGKTSTPFREMIRRMPDVAEEVLNKCTIADPRKSDPGDEDYQVAFNYEFIEDFRDKKDDDGVKEVDSGRRKSKKKMSEEKKTYNISFSDVNRREMPGYTTDWGPVGFKKANHPLEIMMKSGQLKLLTHPLVGSLLHHKWNKFGMIFYFLNLFTYSVFLLFLTIFALLVPNPQTIECMEITGSSEVNRSSEAMSGSGMATSEIACSTSLAMRAVVYISAYIVIVTALGRLILEFSQVIVRRLSYIADLINWMEVPLYLCSITFVWIFNTRCQCPHTWQWQIGAIAIFLAWLNLIIFSAKFPLTGIYVLMFVKIFYTLLKMVTLAILLVVAFGLTFYMTFYDPAIIRSPFSHPGRSLLKTMTMATGEFNFDSIFRQDTTGEEDSQEEIPFPPISYILWVVFVILMPILLTNMLIGLATDEIQAIQKEAAVTKLALQVKQVLTIEEILPKQLRRRFITGSKVVSPNKKTNLFKRLAFTIWGGEHYDTHSSLKRALKHKLKTVGTDGATHTEMSTLLKEMSEMKKSVSTQISQMQSQMQSQMDILIRELPKKH